MRIAKQYKKHVFCLEGNWVSDLRDKSTIQAALDFLNVNCDIKHIRKNAVTKDSVKYYLKKWKQKKYKDYSICYFAYHGKPGYIEVGNETMTLEELADVLENSCENKIIHFGSCLTLAVSNARLKKFLEKTKALCICGFKEEIGFLTSSVFDMILIEKFQKYKDVSCVDRDIKLYYQSLVEILNFKIYYI